MAMAAAMTRTGTVATTVALTIATDATTTVVATTAATVMIGVKMIEAMAATMTVATNAVTAMMVTAETDTAAAMTATAMAPEAALEGATTATDTTAKLSATLLDLESLRVAPRMVKPLPAPMRAKPTEVRATIEWNSHVRANAPRLRPSNAMMARLASSDHMRGTLGGSCSLGTLCAPSFSLLSVVFDIFFPVSFFDSYGPLQLPIGTCTFGSFVRYATAREGKTKKTVIRSSPCSYLLLVGLAATGFSVGRRMELPDLCRINHFINRHVSRQQS